MLHVSFITSTLSAHVTFDGHVEKKPSIVKCEDVVPEIQRLKRILEAEREERSRLELEKEKMRQEKEMMEEQRDKERGQSLNYCNNSDSLEKKSITKYGGQ